MAGYTYYIKIEDGTAVEHPHHIDNLLHCYGTIPSNYEPFVNNNVRQIFDITKNVELKYEKNDGVWTNVWYYTDKSDAEILIIKQELLESSNTEIKIKLSIASNTIIELTEKNDVEGLTIWNEYLNKLNNWKLENYNALLSPETPIFANTITFSSGTGVYTVEPIFQSDDSTLENAYYIGGVLDHIRNWDCNCKTLSIGTDPFSPTSSPKIGEILYGKISEAQYIIESVNDKKWIYPQVYP